MSERIENIHFAMRGPAITPQWISLLYRRLQKIEQIKPDHCD